MEYQYDSDISEDTRDLISRGLATDTCKYRSRTELGSGEREVAPNRSMNGTARTFVFRCHTLCQWKNPLPGVLTLFVGKMPKTKNITITLMKNQSISYYISCTRRQLIFVMFHILGQKS